MERKHPRMDKCCLFPAPFISAAIAFGSAGRLDILDSLSASSLFHVRCKWNGRCKRQNHFISKKSGRPQVTPAQSAGYGPAISLVLQYDVSESCRLFPGTFCSNLCVRIYWICIAGGQVLPHLTNINSESVLGDPSAGHLTVFSGSSSSLELIIESVMIRHQVSGKSFRSQ